MAATVLVGATHTDSSAEYESARQLLIEQFHDVLSAEDVVRCFAAARAALRGRSLESAENAARVSRDAIEIRLRRHAATVGLGA